MVAIVEILEAGHIPHRPPKVDKDALYLHFPCCTDHELAQLHPDRRDHLVDCVLVFVRLTEVIGAIEEVEVMVPLRVAADLSTCND